MDIQAQLIQWRRELHQIPELAFEEYLTAKYIRQELKKMGYQYQTIAKTGTYIYIDNHQSSTIAIRGEMDGLEIQEENQIEYKSQHEHFMHACGHDGHMSVLLGVAKILKENPIQCRSNILLVFQPAEESVGGACAIIKSGILKKYHVKEIYGMHLMPYIDEGRVACKKGELMAMCGEFNVEIHGKQSHVGIPEKGIDSIMIASYALQHYQNIVSKRLSPFKHVLVHIGKINGGDVRNSIAPFVCMQGTIRCFDTFVFQDILNSIQDIHQGLQTIYHCQIAYTCTSRYPPVINSEKLYKYFVKNIKECVELNQPVLLADDFAFYQEEVSGLYFFLGTRNSKYYSGLHTSTFQFDECVLKKGVDIFLKVLKK